MDNITNGILFEHDKIMDEETLDRLRDDISSYLIPVEKVLPPDGKWCLWVSITGTIQIARFKEDAINHFFPHSGSFELEDAVAWMPLPKR